MMKPKILLMLLMVCGMGAVQLPARPLVYYMDVCNFYDGDDQPYIEFYLDIAAASLTYVTDGEGRFVGKAKIELEVKKEGTEDVVYERSFELLNPGVKDSSAKKLDYGILDVRRISLDPGNYTFSGLLRDANNPEGKRYQFVKELEVEPGKEMLTYLSDVTFIQAFSPSKGNAPHSKHGYNILPLVNNGTFLDRDSLHFYLEAYNVDQEAEDVFFVNSYLSLANSTSKLPGYQKVIRLDPAGLNLIQAGYSIAYLPSQTYYLNIELYNKQQKLIGSTSKRFFVSNSRVDAPMVSNNSDLKYDDHFELDEAELDYYIHTLHYISTPTEIDFVDALGTEADKQIYFMNFWDKRKENPADSPAKPWKSYKSRVDHANAKFKAAHLEGWRTARGRVMLTYGAPNDIERQPSSNQTHPYQIWRYNKLATQPNVQFVFWNPNEATNDYELIHSNRLGEPNNPRWQYEVLRNSPQRGLDSDQLFDETDPW